MVSQTEKDKKTRSNLINECKELLQKKYENKLPPHVHTHSPVDEVCHPVVLHYVQKCNQKMSEISELKKTCEEKKGVPTSADTHLITPYTIYLLRKFE